MRRLYTFFRSSTSYRLRIALAFKGLDWEPCYISLPRMEHRAQDYMALNPQGLVPTLIEDDGAVLAQSLAMMEYLEERYPDPPLLPRGPIAVWHSFLGSVIGGAADRPPVTICRRRRQSSAAMP